jgi:hypothetical protein
MYESLVAFSLARLRLLIPLVSYCPDKGTFCINFGRHEYIYELLKVAIPKRLFIRNIVYSDPYAKPLS